jgi:hypothetical protein
LSPRGAPRVLCLCLLALISAASAQDTRDTWTKVEHVIAFADVHGAYDDLTQLLRSAGVVDKDLRWSAGAAHVVSTGDLLDRGPGSRQVMDLLMRLQGEAAAAGGALHVVLGNHEAMNLLGDLRYVTPTEFAAYAGDEPAGERERLRTEWIAQHGQGSAAKFDERFPTGYFGQRAAFSREGKYGRWLLGLPVAIVIDDTLFMHGGPSQVLSGLSLGEINRRYRSALSDYLSTLAALEKAGLVRLNDPFDERAALAQKRLASGSADRDLLRRFSDADLNAMINPDGPNWSRGAAMCNEVSESDVLKPLLEKLGVKRLVIGHTVTHDQRVASRFDGAVIKLDTGMNRAAYRGHPAALLLEKGTARVTYADEAGPPVVISAEPLFITSPAIDDATIGSILATGKVTVGAARSPGMFDVTVELEGRRVPALFVQARGDALNKELAAQRVDRELQLGLVPATVKREVNGQQGFLQARPTRWVTQADVEAQSLRPGGWCALPPQLELMYAFDALIGNPRARERILYDASEWRLLLTGHERAFGTSKALPPQLQARPPQPGQELQRRLAALDATSLERAVGDLLGERERSAILARRDALLAGKPARVAGR